jgi:hypothetical protein
VQFGTLRLRAGTCAKFVLVLSVHCSTQSQIEVLSFFFFAKNRLTYKVGLSKIYNFHLHDLFNI